MAVRGRGLLHVTSWSSNMSRVLRKHLSCVVTCRSRLSRYPRTCRRICTCESSSRSRCIIYGHCFFWVSVGTHVVGRHNCGRSRMLSGRATTATASHHQQSLLAGREICRAAIESLSPRQLVGGSVKVVDAAGSGAVLGVRGREYALDHNVKVVAFGKAVLGMLDALESLLGDHIIAGVASVPMGSSERRYNDTFHNVNRNKSKVRVLEGAAGNLPDCQALSAASEILSLCREARDGEIVVALVSGGGSALLPCPIQGVTLQEKRTVIEALSKAGASIHELNVFRKFFSQTKGGKLAAAAYSAQMVALILSDVIGNPLDTIASGPTVPSNISRDDVITLLDKCSVTQSLPESIQSVLSTPHRQTQKLCPESSGEGVPIENGSYKHVQNVIVGSNSIATAAAADMASSMGYRPVVWSHSVQGEARLLGEAFAIFAHSHRNSERLSLLRKELCFVELAQSNPAMVAEFESLDANLDIESPCNLCLISGGEPTVTVTGNGKGGRNQELALTFSLKYNQLCRQSDEAKLTPTRAAECVLFSLGTDGQDGPTDAAGAVGHASLIHSAAAQGIDAEGCLRRNDSYSFFSQVEGGKYHLKTGLTGTNVMDIHCILLTHTLPC